MVTKKTKEAEDWKDVALHFAVGTMRELGNNVLRSFHERLDRVVASIARKLFSMLLLCVGLTFLLVGLAHLVNDLIGGSSSMGYILVGAIAMATAMILSIVKEDRA